MFLLPLQRIIYSFQNYVSHCQISLVFKIEWKRTTCLDCCVYTAFYIVTVMFQRLTCPPWFIVSMVKSILLQKLPLSDNIDYGLYLSYPLEYIHNSSCGDTGQVSR